MGPRLLMINANDDVLTLENLKNTGYKPDSIRYCTEKYFDQISVNIANALFIDSLIMVSIEVQNNSINSIVITDFEISSILGSEIAVINYYETYEGRIIEPGESSLLDNYYIPIEANLFKSRHLNSKFASPQIQYEYIYHVIWSFNYNVIEQYLNNQSLATYFSCEDPKEFLVSPYKLICCTQA
jgi:hypothetical protein